VQAPEFAASFVRRPASTLQARRKPVRAKWIVLGFVAVLLGALGGALLSPQPADAVSKEIIQLQEQVAQLLQGQQDLRSAVDSDNASLRTLVQQETSAVNHLATQMGSLQQAMQQVQANGNSQISTVAQQTQGLSDNMQDVLSRVGKLQQQLQDMQGLLQSIDSKVSNTAPQNGTPTNPTNGTQGPGPGQGPGPSSQNDSAPMPNNSGGSSLSGMPPISADTLYQNGLRDYNTGDYDLAHQEFADYIRNFPSNDLASNAQFYLGEILYAQHDYKSAINAYDAVLTNYPNSFKLSDSLLKKAMAEEELHMRTSAARDYRAVERRFPGSPAARRAQAKLREMR
jgi:tol-pal system protein YbgF